jgi:hypothetical protein
MEGASKRGRRPAVDRGVEEERPIVKGDVLPHSVVPASTVAGVSVALSVRHR